MKHDYERINSKSFKNKQYVGKNELITIIALLIVIVILF